MNSQPPRHHFVPPDDAGPYTLKKILDEIPLFTDEGPEVVSVTCVEFWNNNLYIGTSASELLHLVALPADDASEPSTFILASRLQPGGYYVTPSSGYMSGVRQIIVLPGVSKACVLCNGVVSFYTLPELTPASPSKEPTGIQWLGGIDENEERDNPDGQVVMMANSRRIMLIPLFPISSISSEVEPPPVANRPLAGHSRSTSLGNPLSIGHSASAINPTQLPESSIPDRNSTLAAIKEHSELASRPRSSSETSPAKQPRKIVKEKLGPHILTPTSSEFMLVTGTAKTEPGIGMFVNLDGDVVRGTIEFACYPEAVLTYDFSSREGLPGEGGEQYVLALFDKVENDERTTGIEIQSLSDTAEVTASKTWVSLPSQAIGNSGLHHCLSSHSHFFSEVTHLLQLVRFRPTTLVAESDPRTQASMKRLEQETALFDNGSPPASSPTIEYEQKRNEEEKRHVKRFGQVQTYAVAWCGIDLWQILQTPLLLQLEGRLLRSGILNSGAYSFNSVNVSELLSLLGSIRQQDTKSEFEYISMNYIRQKASLILFLHIQDIMHNNDELDSACQIVQNAISESSIDPRVIILLIPPLSFEVLQGPNGIWLHQGIMDALTAVEAKYVDFRSVPAPFWMMMCQFLGDWQEKRGYGSISDEKLVFDSVDAALLHLLLYLDQAFPETSQFHIAIRAKLHKVVDEWKGNFQRAIILLERYQRLFVLSRLYHSKRLIKDVLSTWKRIVEGEHDADISLTIAAVEMQIRKYLTQVAEPSLVHEYGLWLAQRNPDLAVELFADHNTRVKLTPAEVVSTLKDQAPGAVQKYLEHLVFGKHLGQYADDLIGYYLDSVLNVLETSEAARHSLEESYATYRALEMPKPTYLNFITQNTPPQPWWQSRLRLLQLLGSGGYATHNAAGKELTYSVDKVLERLTPFSSYLVSESIILDARQGRHKEALRLLTHGLGDYDTAVRYCYFGGPAPVSSVSIDASLLPSKAVQQEHFRYLFGEFVQIQDVEDRLERTSRLLGTFATWFDPLTVFESIPQDWTIEMLSEFLLRSFRAATTARNEALIVKALSAAQNLQRQATFIDICEKLGPQFHSENANSASQD